MHSLLTILMNFIPSRASTHSKTPVSTGTYQQYEPTGKKTATLTHVM